MAGGLGYLPRRGVSSQLARELLTRRGVERLARYRPLELLMLLRDLVPELGQAVWNTLLLGCGPDSVRFKAMHTGEDGKQEEDPQSSALIEDLWTRQPKEVGHKSAVLAKNVLMVLFSGMCAMEAVPGPLLTGVQTVWPTHTLTLEFRRDPDGALVLWQRQENNPLAPLGWAPMPMNRFFWDSLHGFPDDPYGSPPLATALMPLLDYQSFSRDLTIAFHRVGLPRYDVTFDFAAAAKVAIDVERKTAPADIAASVRRQFDEFVAGFQGLKVDDAFFHPVGTEVNTTGSGEKMPDIPGIFDIYRYRLVVALKQNPVLMSFVEGSTETWSDIQWELAINGLGAIVGCGASPMRDCAQLHLQLLGNDCTVEVEQKPLKSVQRLQDAQAEALEIDNEVRKRDEGFQTQDTASMTLTGSAPVAPGPVRARQPSPLLPKPTDRTPPDKAPAQQKRRPKSRRKPANNED